MTEANVPQGKTSAGTSLKVTFNISVDNFDVDWEKVPPSRLADYLKSTTASIIAESTYTMADYLNRVLVESNIWNLSVEVDSESHLSDSDIDKLLGGSTE